MKIRPEHRPTGDPCECGEPASFHYVRTRRASAPSAWIEHMAIDRHGREIVTGNCRRRFRFGRVCGGPAEQHRPRRRPARAAPELPAARARSRKKPTVEDLPLVVLDGEGFTERGARPTTLDPNTGECTHGKKGGAYCDCSHRYVYAAACTEDGVTLGEVEGLAGLSSAELLHWLANLAHAGHPRALQPHLTCFWFSGGYDTAFFVKDLPDATIWSLARPEERPFELGGDEVLCDKNGKPRRAQPTSCYWLPGDPTLTGKEARAAVHQATGRYQGREEAHGFKLDYVRGRFSVKRVDHIRLDRKGKEIECGPSVTIWDPWSLWACSLVTALKRWDVGSKEEREAIERLKGERGRFTPEMFSEVQDYCRQECKLTAQMLRKVLTSARDAGMPLKSYFGAGSLGGAMLEAWGVREFLGTPMVDGSAKLAALFKHAVGCAYGGGRFETSEIGVVRGPDGDCHSADLNSAYPSAQAAGMPCQRHGIWTHHSGGDLERLLASKRTRYALVKARARATPHNRTWGPFMWRTSEGALIYPLTSPGSWVWLPEYRAAREAPKLWDVRALEAFVYTTECDCQPFKQVPSTYLERLKLGKDGAGLVLKTALASSYGKTAQSVGDAPFQEFCWAGITTSHARAQLLRGIAAAEKPEDVFMLATDALYSKVKLELPGPPDTGTGRVEVKGRPCTCEKGKPWAPAPYPPPDGWKACERHVDKPLGGWSLSHHKGGLLVIRPGFYFGLGYDDTADVDTERERDKGRARSIGRATMARHRKRLLAHWQAFEPTAKQGAARAALDLGADELMRAATSYPGPYYFRRDPRDPKSVEEGVSRFVGFKAGITAVPVRCAKCKSEEHSTRMHGSKSKRRAVVVKRSPEYGRWISQEQQIAWVGWPKRAVAPLLPGNRLPAWEAPPESDRKTGAKDRGALAKYDRESPDFGKLASEPYGWAVGRRPVNSEITRALHSLEDEMSDSPNDVWDEDVFDTN